MRCLDCGNTDVFITEKFFLHWCKVNGEGSIITIDQRQGDEDAHIDPEEAYVECGECYSTNVEED